MFLGILLIILSFALFFIVIVANVETPDIFKYLMLGSLISLALGIVFLYEDEPKAIEVYQGKTTLEITYRDGVPIDSVVVYKE